MWKYKFKGSNRLPNHVIHSISENLSALKDHIPVEFARKPRSLLESNRWKATQLLSPLNRSSCSQAKIT